MAAMKLLEMKTSREVVLAIHLGFVLVMTNFLFSQTIPLGLYMLACVWLFVATLVGYHRGVGRTPTVRERLVPSGLLLLQAVPLMLVFFILFPRVQGPLWALPQDARAGMSGLSDSMTPGNISKLIQSEATAFRVQFEGDIPPYSTLYWRGPVLWRLRRADLAGPGVHHHRKPRLRPRRAPGALYRHGRAPRQALALRPRRADLAAARVEHPPRPGDPLRAARGHAHALRDHVRPRLPLRRAPARELPRPGPLLRRTPQPAHRRPRPPVGRRVGQRPRRS